MRNQIHVVFRLRMNWLVIQRTAGIVLLTMVILLSACAAPAQQGAVSIDPRPIGVPENASPYEKGQEILRVVIELVKHGSLRDTEFASKLLRLHVAPGKGVPYTSAPEFPQQLVSTFAYFIRDFSSNRESVDFQLNPDTVCLRSSEFLEAFTKEFGIGTQILDVSASPNPPFKRIAPAVGWGRVPRLHDGRSSYLQQQMPNGLSVSAVFASIPGCAARVSIDRYEFTAR